MRGPAGSRKRITLNVRGDFIRILVLVCVAATAGSFAVNRGKGSEARTPVRQAVRVSQQPVKAVPDRQVTIQPKTSATLSEPQAVASIQSLPESSGFRMLWLATLLGLVLALRRQRKRA